MVISVKRTGCLPPYKGLLALIIFSLESDLIIFSTDNLRMALVMLWIAPLVMAILSLIFMRIAHFSIKLSSVEVACKDGMKALNLSKEPITEIFAEPKFPTLLCAILASSIQNSEIAVVFGFSNIPILMGLEWQRLRYSVIVTSFFYPFSGAIVGYVGVLLWKVFDRT